MPAQPASGVSAVCILYGRKAREDLFDDYLAREHLARLKALLGLEETGAVSEYEASESDPADILDEVATPSLWGGARFVILRGAEALLDPPAAQRPQLEAVVERMRAFAAQHSPPGHLALVASALKVERGRPATPFKPAMALIKAVEEAGGLFSCVPPFESALKRALIKKAAAAGCRLPPASARTLVETVGPDQLALMEELEKLIAAGDEGAVITPEQVEALAAARPQATAFSLADCILDGDTRSALDQLAQLRSTPATRAFGYLTTGLASSFRRYRDARRLVESGRSPRQAAGSVGVPRFFQEGFVRRLSRWKEKDLSALLVRLLQCDVEVKTGSVQEETALVTFVSDACARRPQHGELVGRWIYEV